ncbi:MAG: amidohydrolase family protein [Saprospiraceae bacterium]|nr:amidohydrolase family protein [Saprospiraceae bacterium]MCF8250608.1 amidohydrolase family protein [Saprospiraceae bacterium]MCF8281425.1 amidohydrolase family protein [Bacteroidales bacterium]MCF8313072.1 amidohydrolase family protein [Saprospiraceae bacterium]MCF8441563.1 amidohydrolase family protein [Saprospiraceae bacterium]
MKKLIFVALFFTYLIPHTSYLNAQETFPRNGVADNREGLYAFTNATIYKSWNEKLENATLIIRKGKVAAIGNGIAVPKDAVVIDAAGKTIYPAFIDIYTDYGMPEKKDGGPGGGGGRGQQMLSDKGGAYAWNEALKPEYQAFENFKTNEKAAGELRKLGFGAVLSHNMDGIDRGSSVMVTLGDGNEHEVIVKERVGHHLSFRKGSSSQSYPSSLMGAIALLRQTYLDGQWYKTIGRQEEVNLSLDAWNNQLGLTQFFEVSDKLEVLRAARLGKEFGASYIIRGNGDEYQRLDEMKATGSAFIIPVNFPAAYDVEDPFDAMQVSLAQMKHWELAPTNPARLSTAGISFALTTNGLQKKEEFMGNVRKAIENGLSEADALKALTYVPAGLANSLNELGTLDKGKIANFFIASGNIFEEKTKIHHNWVNGKPFVFKDLESPELAGSYDFAVGDMMQKLEVKASGDGFEMNIVVDDSTKTKVSSKINGDRITLSFKPTGSEQMTRLNGTHGEGKMGGTGQEGGGNWVNWSATRTGDVEPDSSKVKKDEKKPAPAGELGKVTYPFMAFGWTERPKAGTYLLKNATVWTCEKDGILQNTDVLISNGKITKIGKNLSDAGATVVDATGKHITPGIIDEHSHIAISRGVNEGTQASSAEVRIGDVVDSEDIDIYRQLAGGVTCSQLLHGSANPIGGQSAIIKLRWGFSPEEMKNEDAKPFIKFALGENVKQSNWANSGDRFPQTRMGVEQVYEDYFTEAKKYAALKKSDIPIAIGTFRRDLELDALQEILENKRFITCHSYRQSEINMLMVLGDRMGFKVNTFTHILEGYKVADKMREHGAGGSSFADWWAYKFEVWEAIPHNGAIMHEQGVTVAFNSDDAEMARRLNQEAGKAVRFGGVKEEEALKFVTLNPAKLLHIDDQTGSLKIGKDADVVVWSDNPLSVYAKAEMTFVDGIKFFDRKVDETLQAEVDAERNRLIQKSLAVKKDGGNTQRPNGRRRGHYHCDSDMDEGN